jgi:hypothetical protein
MRFVGSAKPTRLISISPSRAIRALVAYVATMLLGALQEADPELARTDRGLALSVYSLVVRRRCVLLQPSTALTIAPLVSSLSSGRASGNSPSLADASALRARDHPGIEPRVKRRLLARACALTK